MAKGGSGREPWWVWWVVFGVVIFFPSIAIGVAHAMVGALHEIADALREASEQAPTTTVTP